jgi:hypothetical protein
MDEPLKNIKFYQTNEKTMFLKTALLRRKNMNYVLLQYYVPKIFLLLLLSMICGFNKSKALKPLILITYIMCGFLHHYSRSEKIKIIIQKKS